MKVIRLMGGCDNRCSFCMVHSELEANAGQHLPLDNVLDEIKACPSGTCLDLFGGEPTLYPHFLELIEFLKSNDASYQIATNGRRFADRDFARRVLGCRPAMIRTSLYGARAKSHDALTRVKGSWQETVNGLRNMTSFSRGTDVMVNYLIFKSNVSQVRDAAIIAYEAGVRSFKFSMPVSTERFPRNLPDPSMVKAMLGHTVEWLHSRRCLFYFEKMPLCLIPIEHIQAFCLEADGGGLEALFERNMPPCTACEMADCCYGLERGILAAHGHGFASPIRYADIDKSAVVALGIDELLSSFAPEHPFTVARLAEDDALDDPDREAAIIDRLTSFRRSGRFVALIP